MASSLASTLAVPSSGFHASSKLASPFLGASFHQLPLQPSCIARGASSCHGSARRLVISAAVGGSSSESVVEDEKPSTSSTAEDREQARANRRRKGFEEYEALKKDLSSTMIGVAAAVDAYIFLTLTPQTGISYTIGALGSYLYLQLLYRHADSVSEENIAEIFQRRRKKTIGIRSSDVQESFEKTIRGCGISLSSPRLVIPAALYSLWAISIHFTGTSSDSFHLEVTPLMLGFFAYKAAALIQAYRDNKDLLMIIATGESDSP
ncbi:hypothetical protein M758_12G035700 [Ceratodon purpureus]|nr:hypothetical protein M758_12G035700 [Ceratodon purpureus]